MLQGQAQPQRRESHMTHPLEFGRIWSNDKCNDHDLIWIDLLGLYRITTRMTSVRCEVWDSQLRVLPQQRSSHLSCTTAALWRVLRNSDGFCFRFGRAASGARSVKRCISPRTCRTCTDCPNPIFNAVGPYCSLLSCFVLLNLYIDPGILVNQALTNMVVAACAGVKVSMRRATSARWASSACAILAFSAAWSGPQSHRHGSQVWVFLAPVWVLHLLLLFALQFIRNGVHLATNGEMPNRNNMNTMWVVNFFSPTSLRQTCRINGQACRPKDS